MTETEAAYLAGIVDGEGCIMIVQPRNKPVLTVKMSSIETIKFVADHFVSNVYIADDRHLPGKQNNKILYYARVQGKKAIKVLESIYKFMITKKDISEYIIKNKNSFFVK